MAFRSVFCVPYWIEIRLIISRRKYFNITNFDGHFLNDSYGLKTNSLFKLPDFIWTGLLIFTYKALCKFYDARPPLDVWIYYNSFISSVNLSIYTDVTWLGGEDMHRNQLKLPISSDTLFCPSFFWIMFIYWRTNYQISGLLRITFYFDSKANTFRNIYKHWKIFDLENIWFRKTWVQSQIESYQRLQKWYLIPHMLNTQHYKVRIKGRVKQSKERSSSYWKRNFRVTLD